MVTYRQLPAFHNMGATLTYAQLDALSRAFAAWLQQKSGLVRGDRVALMMPNLLQYPIALFGVLRAGMVVVNTNPLVYAARTRASAEGLRRQGHRHPGEFRARAAASAAAHGSETSAGDRRRRSVGHAERFHRELRAASCAQASAAVEHAGFNPFQRRVRQRPGAQARAGRRWVTTISRFCNTPAAPPASPRPRSSPIATSWPTCCRRSPGSGPRCRPAARASSSPRCRCITSSRSPANCLAFLPLGAHERADHQPARFPRIRQGAEETPLQLHSAGSTRCSTRCCTPPASTPSISRICAAALRGGMARAIGGRQAAGNKVTGNALTQGLGPDRNLAQRPAQSHRRGFYGSMGLPISSTDVSIRDDVGAELPVNGVGEICVFGPQVMRGYWNRPDETEKVMFGDWLRTGDIGRMDAKGYRLHRRPQEGHDSGVRFQCIPERGGERRGRASGRAGGRRGRPARCERRRSGGAVRGEEGSGSDRARH